MIKKKCFAMSKNSDYTLPRDRHKAESEITCYALNDEAFMSMAFYGKCGTRECPFFKERREDVRHG